jgi:RimJ/RimL family protein N-acetyltransferase
MSVTIEQHTDPKRFLAASHAWLRAAEAENNLLLGSALGWRGGQPADTPAYWVTVHEGNQLVTCACRIPPHPVVLSRAGTRAVADLAEFLSNTDSAIGSVNGPTTEAEAFAAAWVALNGGRWRTRFRMRLHELTRLSLPTRAPAGTLRRAGEADLALAREWIAAYERDVRMHTSAGDVARRLIDRGQLYLWIDGGEARAMAAAVRETDTGCSINTVYTPPQFRRGGYATAAVAALTERLLESGRRFCCLYTDAANPTSNSIYAKIGYRPIRDDSEIELERQ